LVISYPTYYFTLVMTNPILLNLAPGHWELLKNTDVQCPFDREMVNVQCWNCGWRRSEDERKMTLLGLAEPVWHRRAIPRGRR
jgi:hypothetical protein